MKHVAKTIDEIQQELMDLITRAQGIPNGREYDEEREVVSTARFNRESLLETIEEYDGSTGCLGDVLPTSIKGTLDYAEHWGGHRLDIHKARREFTEEEFTDGEFRNRLAQLEGMIEMYESITAVSSWTSGEYAKGEENTCPRCGSDEVTGSEVDVEGERCFQHVYCNSCEAQWDDVYKLTGYTNLD
jgi:hypothetical protein